MKDVVTEGSTSPRKIAVAITKTGKVQRDVEQAEKLLNESTGVLSGPLTTAQAAEAIQSAVQKNAGAEEKLHEAGEELSTVKDLLQAAEDELTRRAGNSGHGADSVIPHLASRR